MRRLKQKILFVLFGFVCFFTIITLSKFAIAKQSIPDLIVGAKNDVENEILGEIVVQTLQKHSNLSIGRKYNLDGYFCFQALLSGDISLYCEYSGTALLAILGERSFIADSDMETYLKEQFLSRYGVCWMDSFGFENGFVILSARETSDKRVVAVDPELALRPEFSLLKDNSHLLKSSKVVFMDYNLGYLALHALFPIICPAKNS